MRQRDELMAHNEQVKLTATSVNAVGLAVVGFGVVRPFIDADLGLNLASLASAVTGLALHRLAHYILKQLESDT